MNRLFRGAAAALVLIFALEISAQEVLEFRFADKRTSVQKADGKEICKIISEKLLKQNGPYGFGSFDSYYCYEGKSKNATYVLNFTLTNQTIEIKLADTNLDLKNRKVIAELNLKTPKNWQKAFDDETLRNLLSLTLLRKFKRHLYLPPAGVNLESATYKTPAMPQNKKMILTLPPNLLLFADEQTEKLPVDKLELITLRFLGFTTDSSKTGTESDSPTWQVDGFETGNLNIKIQGWFYAPKEVSPTYEKLKELFVVGYESLAGIRELPEDEGDLITDALNSVLDRIPSYAVVEFGFSTAKQPELLKKSKFFRLSSSIALFNDHEAHVFYEEIPRAKDSTGQEIFFQRISAGYSFGFNIEKLTLGALTRIDVTPRVSLWEIDARLRTSGSDGTTTPEQFKLDNNFSLGVEGGISRVFSKVVIRGFVGFGISNAQKANVTTTVKNYNAGGSLLYPGHNFNWVDLVYMLTWRYNNLEFQNGEDSDIEDINVANHFAGFGLGVSW